MFWRMWAMKPAPTVHSSASFCSKKEAERAKAGFDLIIAAGGGDGTINEVVNMANLDERPKLAFIPTGTTNDWRVL